MAIGIKTVVSFLPREVIDVAENYRYLESALAAMPEHERERLLAARPGSVHRFREASAAEFMGLAVVERLLRESGIDRGELDGMLVMQSGGRQFMPLLGSYLHLNLGLPKDCVVRNVVDGDSGLASSLFLAKQYVKSGICKNVAVVAVGSLIGGQTRFGIDLTSPEAMLYGDGAAVALVTSGDDVALELIGYSYETDAIRHRYGGTLVGAMDFVRHPLNPDLADAAMTMNVACSFAMTPDEGFLEHISADGYLSGLLGRACKQSGIGIQELRAVFASHQPLAIESWTEDLDKSGIGSEALRSTYRTCGMMGVPDALVDLAELGGDLASGDLAALVAPTLGTHTGVALMRRL